ncbi:hypothetical protein ACWGKK_14655 [Streptomyces chartreusis]
MPVIDGLSSRALAEILCLERTRNYLQPGAISAAVRLWKDYEWGNVHWHCAAIPSSPVLSSMP